MTRKLLSAVIVIAVFCIPSYALDDGEFFRLCREGDYAQISRTLRLSPRLINMKTPGGLTPLMAAAESNKDPAVISLLIKSGADVNAEMFSGMTALLWASWRNPNPDVIRMLVSHGANTDAESDNGKRVDDYALMNEKLAGINITDILKHKPPEKTTTVPQQIIPKPAEKPSIEPISTGSIDFLELCASGTPQEIWNAIKKNHQNPNAKNYYGTTAIMFAAGKNRSVDSIWWLYKAGADVNARDNGGRTPLMYAAESNRNPGIFRALLRAGADINAEDKSGRTALMIAAGKNPEPSVISVLAEGSDVNRQNAKGWTALFWAAYSSENPGVILALLKAGADPSIRGSFGELALDYARRNKKLAGSDALRLLEELSR